MDYLLTAAGIVLVLLVVGLLVEAVDALLDHEDKQHLVGRLTSFWVAVAELTIAEQLVAALRSRRALMKRRRGRYLILFSLLCLLVCVVASLDTITADNKTTRAALLQIISLDFDLRFVVESTSRIAEYSTFFVEKENYCEPLLKGWETPVLALGLQRANYDAFVLSANPAMLKSALIASAFIQSALLWIFLCVALSISFRVTLWLLAITTSSKLALMLMIIVALFLAVSLPQMLINTVMFGAITFMVAWFGGVIDFAFFADASYWSLIIGSAGMGIGVTLMPLYSIAIVATQVNLPAVAAWITSAIFLALINLSYDRIFLFIEDGKRLLRGDIAISAAESIINWAIFVDVLFSLVFLIPSIGLVTLLRFPFAKRMVLNSVQYFADHPRGPLYAVSRLFTAVAESIKRLRN